MAQRQRIDWSSLWKKDEWLAVWLGFLIIVLLIAGLQVKTPSFRWTTGGEFASFVKGTAQQVETLIQAAADAGETDVQDSAVALRAVIEKGDRKASGNAGKQLEEAARSAKDPGVKKKAGDIGKNVSGQAGRLAGTVFSWANIWLALQIGIAYLILSIIAMALMGSLREVLSLAFPLFSPSPGSGNSSPATTRSLSTDWNMYSGASSSACSSATSSGFRAGSRRP